jgi:hypothetical protein
MTDRMLKMFKPKPKTTAAPAAGIANPAAGDGRPSGVD